jgi:hypothetical protein
MTQFYCFTCDRPRDSNDEDMADYSDLDNPICGSCVQDAKDNLEQQLQDTWNILDQDTQAINDFCKEPS